jgi:nucleotide-binding universal stress UspA family protein
MKAIEKIMVAIDFSEYSRSALIYAAQLARSLGAKILAVHVIHQRDLDAFRRALTGYGDEILRNHIDSIEADRTERLAELIRSTECEALVTQRSITVGVPWVALLEVIKVHQPDLLVLSTKGRSNLADTIIGSCARKMYRRSPIPVLSLRPQNISAPG